jgi:hypothetical protein
MRVEVLKVSGVADSLVWPTRLYGRLACKTRYQVYMIRMLLRKNIR